MRSVERNPVYPDWVRYAVADDRPNVKPDDSGNKIQAYLLNTRTGKKIGSVDPRAPFFSAKTQAVYYRDSKGDFLLSAEGAAKRIETIPDDDDSLEQAANDKCIDDGKSLHGSWLREGREIDRGKGKLFWNVTEGCPTGQ